MRLPILTYHSLDESGSPVSVRPLMLRRHLASLHAAGYTALPLGEALACLAPGGLHSGLDSQPARVPARVVALTFDDGYASVYEHAYPLLASYGWRATV